MKCLLIFDHLNDIIYTKYNSKFAEHINEFATVQGFQKDAEHPETDVNADIIVQVFSPIITSQRIMNCQFGNSYTSIQCEGGLNMCFDEFMGYLFVSVGNEDVSKTKHFLRICVTMVRYLCGPDVCQLKANEKTEETLSNLLESWLYMHDNDQAICVEALEQLVVNSDLSSVTLQALRKSVDKLNASIEYSKIHALLLVRNKFLSLYSSQNARELSASDILFSIILSQSISIKNQTDKMNSEGADTDEAHGILDDSSEVHSHQVLLAGSNYNSSCLAHVIHIIQINEGINLLYLLEVGNSAVSSYLYETFCHLHSIQLVQIQRDAETLRPAFESMDATVKKLHDALRKVKISAIENCSKQLVRKWDLIRKKYLDFIKTNSDEALLRAETLILGFLENLKQLLSLTSVEEEILMSTQGHAVEVSKIVREKLNSFDDFLQVKAIRNFSLGSYLEEFPGLVHFLYIDRTNHRITAPTLDFSSDETNKLTKKKIWTMVHFSRNHLQEGNLSLIWKDSIFNYSYFFWFEDLSGTPLKPSIFPINSSKALPLPGLLGSDFYVKLKEVCFPKMQPAKIRCFELYCIHLGLVTASCVLEHTRRLAATVWELRGHPTHPIDLL